MGLRRNDVGLGKFRETPVVQRSLRRKSGIFSNLSPKNLFSIDSPLPLGEG